MMSFRNFWRIKEVENCAVCILKPCFDSAVWLIPYRGYCEHSEKYYSSKAHFQETKGCYWMYCIAALIIVALIWNCFYILGICAEDSVVCILLITDELSGIYGVSLYLTILIKARYHMAATNIMCDIMKGKCRKYNSMSLEPDDSLHFISAHPDIWNQLLDYFQVNSYNQRDNRTNHKYCSYPTE
ncbi:hypothetical protein JTB14_036117 [Gonioctena quinquepunctata]|nr:hypothetical protein JTB14_036117 [Gonioctena quinquepunctata]